MCLNRPMAIEIGQGHKMFASTCSELTFEAVWEHFKMPLIKSKTDCF